MRAETKMYIRFNQETLRESQRSGIETPYNRRLRLGILCKYAIGFPRGLLVCLRSGESVEVKDGMGSEPEFNTNFIVSEKHIPYCNKPNIEDMKAKIAVEKAIAESKKNITVDKADIIKNKKAMAKSRYLTHRDRDLYNKEIEALNKELKDLSKVKVPVGVTDRAAQAIEVVRTLSQRSR